MIIKKFTLSKRAVSPLIATVLLIAFSVALGAVVMNWGRSFVTERTEKVDTDTDVQLQCTTDIILQFVEIANSKQVCQMSTSNTTRVLVQNIGSSDASGLVMRVIDDSSNIMVYQYNTTLGSGEAVKLEVNWDTEGYSGIGTISYVAVAPMISYPGTGELKVCSNNNIEVSQVNTCS